MKRTLLVAFLSFLTLAGYAQGHDIHGTNTFIGIYGGVGVATRNNYDIGISGGFEFEKGIASRNSADSRMGIGANIFYQSFSLLYDREQFDARHGMGNAGVLDRVNAAYIFVTPKFDVGIGRRQNTHGYITVGAGFKMSGYDTLRKWDHSFGNSGVGNYDSTLDMSKNLKSMALRLGAGFKEYIYLGNHWRFTITEDFGFLASPITTTGLPSDPSRTQYSSPSGLNPLYLSIQIGIMHTKYP